MSALDRIIAALGLLGLVAFLGLIAIWVKHVDLIVVLVIGIGMAAFDFIRQIARRER